MCFVSLLILGSVSKNLKPVSKFGQFFLACPVSCANTKNIQISEIRPKVSSIIFSLDSFIPEVLPNATIFSLSLSLAHSLTHMLLHQLSLTYTPTSTLSQTRTPPHSPFLIGLCVIFHMFRL